jgi:lysozyme family protein
MVAGWTRRHVLNAGGAGLAAAAATLPLSARARPVTLPGGLDALLPAEVRSLLPDDARGALDVVGQLLKLEQQAKALRLPPTILHFGNGAIPADPGRLYELVMPRLVALVDRSERRSPAFAEKAGALLATLHRSQYALPAAWSRLGEQPAEGGSLSLLPDENETLELPRGTIELPPGELPPAETMLPPVTRSHRFAELAGEYAAWFAAASLRPEHQESANWHLTMMEASKDRYAAVGKPLGVPWQFIAAVHGLEASFNFRAHLHNGDFPLTQRTRQVPPGRPLVWLPPSNWEASATDALKLMGFAHQVDWSLPRMLYRLETYNGFGYRLSGRATPYLWSFSNLYSSGKFVADGHFDAKAKSQQCGAAVMLKVLDLAGKLDAPSA